MADAVSGHAGTAGDEAAVDTATADRGGASGEHAARPHILADAVALGAAVAAPDERGAVWRLEERERHLDANVIALPPGERIDEHAGPEEDVLLHVIAGSGTLRSGEQQLPLTEGALVWLPRRSRREVIAGGDGLRYLSVHRRKPGLQVGRRP